MKNWQLVLVQLWGHCFVPVGVFILFFAPLVLAPPNPSGMVFFLFILPPILAVLGSIVLWVSRWKGNVRLQKRMAIILIVFPVVSVVPLFVWQ